MGSCVSCKRTKDVVDPQRLPAIIFADKHFLARATELNSDVCCKDPACKKNKVDYDAMI